MLLTRSPLSPGPKPWFSLDLHVLSAPPAFVLSQDQTLREGLVVPELENWTLEPRTVFNSSLMLDRLPIRVDRIIKPHAERPAASLSLQATACERSRRSTLLSFQSSMPIESGKKKTSADSRQRPTNDSVRDVSDSFEGRSGVE